MWGRRLPSLPPPAKALCYIVLSVLRFVILTVKYFEVWDWTKYPSSLRRDSQKASDWERRNRTAIRMWLRKLLFGSLYMMCFWSINILSCITIYRASLYINMHHYISCITIYHASLYIMHHCIWFFSVNRLPKKMLNWRHWILHISLSRVRPWTVWMKLHPSYIAPSGVFVKI